MDLWIGFFKVGSMLATGFFAGLALLKKFKDDDGHVTKWGKIALGGIVFSAILSLSLFVLETSSAREKAKQAQLDAEATGEKLVRILDKAEATVRRTTELREGMDQTIKAQQENLETTKNVAVDMKESVRAQNVLLTKSEQISSGVQSGLEKQIRTLSATLQVAQKSDVALTQLGRLQYPLNNLGAQVFIKVYTYHPLLTAARVDINKRAQTLAERLRISGQKELHVESEGLAVYDSEIQLFREDNSLLSSQEPDLKLLLSETMLWFQVYKGKPSNDDIAKKRADLFFTYSSYSFIPVQDDVALKTGNLYYHYADNSFLIIGVERRPIRFAETSKDIFSVLDFCGSTLVISAPPGVIDNGYSISEVVITTSLDQRIIIPSEALRLRRAGTDLVLVYEFPNTIEELFAGRSKSLS